MSRTHALCCAVAVAGLAAASPTAARSTPVVRTSVELDRLAYHDGVHRAAFRTDGVCFPSQDTIEVRSCPAGSASGTVGSARLGFDAQRFVELAPADVPGAQTTSFDGEQLVRVDVDVYDAGELRIEVAAVEADGVSATPVDGSASEGGRVAGDAVVWDLGAVEPGDYEVSARFDVSNDPERALSFVPQVVVRKQDVSRTAVEHFEGGVHAGRPVRRVHTLTLTQHTGVAVAPPSLDPGEAHADADAGLRQAWGLMPSFVAQGTHYEPTVSTREAVVHDVDRLSPGAGRRANAASIGWAYWSPQPGPKVEPVSEFVYEDGVFRGFRIGLETADYLRFDVDPQTPGPIHDGDAGTIAMTAAAGVVRTDAERRPVRPGGHLRTTWDGSTADAWTDMGQTMVPMAEPNATSPASSTFTEPTRLVEAGVQVFADGGDVDNRAGDDPVSGAPIVLRGKWAIASVATAAPEGSRYEPIVERDGDALRITPSIRPGGYMLESEGSGWELDWSAFHSLGWAEYAPSRADELTLVKTYWFPRGATARIDVLLREGRHEVLRAGPGLWRMTVTQAGADLVKLGATR